MSQDQFDTKEIFNIMVVGVGGQGAIRLGQFFQEFGMLHPEISSVVAMESRGVSQREGSVQSSIRYLRKIQNNVKSSSFSQLSPSIPLQSCDLMIALEPLEFLRYLNYLSPNAIILLNEQSIIPKSVIINKAVYPDLSSCIERIQKIYPKIQIHHKNYSLDALNVNESMIVVNYLMCKDLPALASGIFNHPKYQELLDLIFNVVKKDQ